jgi:hypothetical protein
LREVCGKGGFIKLRDACLAHVPEEVLRVGIRTGIAGIAADGHLVALHECEQTCIADQLFPALRRRFGVQPGLGE